MKKYGIFEIGDDNIPVFIAMYERYSEAEKNIPKDKKFYFIILIYSSHEREDFELGKGAESIRSYK